MATRRAPTEHEEQAAVCEFLDRVGVLYFHPTQEGKRSYREAAYQHAQGFKRGVPDIWIIEPRGSYHGLVIELKAKGGKPTKEQEEWIRLLRLRHYGAAICEGADHAIATIQRYMQMERPEKAHYERLEALMKEDADGIR